MNARSGGDGSLVEDQTRTLIAGCGDIGTRLGTLLAKMGHRVWGIRRNGDQLPRAISPISGSLLDPETLQKLPQKIDTVVFCATPDRVTEADYRDIYINALGMLLERLGDQHQRIKRLLFVSSTSVYQQNRGEWVDEDTLVQPGDPRASFRGRILLEAERLLDTCPWTAVVARCGGIYGPGRNRLIEQVRTRKIQLPEQSPVYSNRIHSDDCAAALAHLISLQQVDDCYLLVDSDPAPKQEVVQWIARCLELPGHVQSDQVQSDQVQSDQVQSDQVQSGQLRSSRSRHYRKSINVDEQGYRGKRCSNQRLLDSGFQFRYPGYREGYQQLISAGQD